MQVDALDVAAAGVLEHAEPQLLTMLSGQLIAASSHKGAQEAERSGSIASAAAAAQVSTSWLHHVQNAAALHHCFLDHPTWHYLGTWLLLCTLFAITWYISLVQRLANSLAWAQCRRIWLQVDVASK